MTVPTRMDPIDGPQRYCRACDEWWADDAEFWYPIRRTNGRVELRCKASAQEASRRWRERHPERVIAASREYRLRNPGRPRRRPLNPKRDRERMRLYMRDYRARRKAQMLTLGTDASSTMAA